MNTHIELRVEQHQNHRELNEQNAGNFSTFQGSNFEAFIKNVPYVNERCLKANYIFWRPIITGT